MAKQHIIKKLLFKKGNMFLEIDGQEYVFELKEISPILAKATKAEREKYEISPSGYGIHWQILDEDLSIDGLLKSNHKPTIEKMNVGCS